MPLVRIEVLAETIQLSNARRYSNAAGPQQGERPPRSRKES